MVELVSTYPVALWMTFEYVPSVLETGTGRATSPPILQTPTTEQRLLRHFRVGST